MDGNFEYDGKVLSYIISDSSNTGTIKIKGVEMLARYIQYYNEKGDNLDGKSVYGESENMQNITPADALRWYRELVEK